MPCVPGGAEDDYNVYEAVGVVWSSPQTINRVVYMNGSYTTNSDGVFAAEFGLQFSPDGVIWTNAGPTWVVTPGYTYNSPSSADGSFTFTGDVASVQGVRCVGRVHTSQTDGSWVAFATELQAFAAPASALPVLTASVGTNSITIFWPGSSFDYVLEAATNLLLPIGWSPVTNSPQAIGDVQTVTVPLVFGQQFFRLHQR
jgi:hypothetical protein